MKKYTVIKPFSLLEKILLVETDEIYAEKVRQMYQIYSPKTRKRIGSLSEKLFNERVNDIDIDDELRLHLEDKRYRNEIGATIGINDFKDWKENLLNIFSKKTPQQRQFEQVVDKLRSQLQAIEETLEIMPKLGNTSQDCQRTAIGNVLRDLDSHINGISLEDFTPNEYSGDFKLSYS
jgi:hypothetical protein